MGQIDRETNDSFIFFWYINNQSEVLEATNYLLDIIIPEVTKELDEKLLENEKNSNELDLIAEIKEILHLYGVNLRYLGLVYCLSESPVNKNLIMIEISSRVIKNLLTMNMSKSMEETIYPLFYNLNKSNIIEKNLFYAVLLILLT